MTPQRGKPPAERFSGGAVTEVAPELHDRTFSKLCRVAPLWQKRARQCYFVWN